jgi:hypothetical protein
LSETIPPTGQNIRAVAHRALLDALPDSMKLCALVRVADAVVAAVEPLIRASERERVYAELGNDHHVIFTEDRWTIEHSVECRLSGRMHECEYHEAIAGIAAGFEPELAGRWLITGIDSEGIPALVRADPLEES